MNRDQKYPKNLYRTLTRKDFSIEPGWVLEARAEELAAKREPFTDPAMLDKGTLDIIVFRIAKQLNALSLDQVLEVVYPFTITPVPDVPEFVLGIVNLRGSIETVFDLGLVLGLGPVVISSKSRLIVVDGGGLHCCFPTDSEVRIVEIHSSILQEPADPLHEELQPFLKGILSNDGELIPLIDMSKILQSDQLVSLYG